MIYAVKAELDEENVAVHYQSAIAIFDEFLTTPDLPQDVITNIAVTKAEIFIKLEKFNEALKCVNNLPVRDEPGDDTIVDGKSGDESIVRDNPGEKIDFIKLTCYLSLEDFEKALDYAEKLKLSNEEQYEYFAIYADAYIAQKLAIKDESQKELAESKYNNAIAFFKNKAFANPMDIFATVFRVRLYAENRRFVQAEELIKLLPGVLQKDLKKYLADCRNES